MIFKVSAHLLNLCFFVFEVVVVVIAIVVAIVMVIIANER